MKLNTIEGMGLFKAMEQSLLGKCYKRGVGSVVYNANAQLISVGHNTTPNGLKNCFEMGTCLRESFHGSMDSIFRFATCRALHSEQIALMDALKIGEQPHTLFVSRHPCLQCARYAIQSGVQRVIYVEPRAEYEVHEELSRAGIQVICVSREEVERIIVDNAKTEDLVQAISKSVFKP